MSRRVHAGLMPRHHRQSQNNLVLDELPTFMCRDASTRSISSSASEISCRLSESCSSLDRDGTGNEAAALTKQLYRSLTEIRNTACVSLSFHPRRQYSSPSVEHCIFARRCNFSMPSTPRCSDAARQNGAVYHPSCDIGRWSAQPVVERLIPRPRSVYKCRCERRARDEN